MRITQEQAIALFQDLGWAGADKWTEARCLAKLALIRDDDSLEADSEDLQELLQKVRASKTDFELVNFEDGGEAPKAKKKAKAAEPEAEADTDEDEAPKAKKKAKAAEPEAEADTDEDEVEDETPAPKAKAPKAKAAEPAAEADEDEVEDETPAPKAKAPKAKKAPKEQRPGVIATIVKALEGATEKKPITKAKILEVLVATFPDREEESMSKTVNVQLSYHLRNFKKLDIQKNEKGYWIAE